MKKTVMVTGASGFIGRQFCQMYADTYRLIPVSLRQTTPESLDFKGVDVVLHLAALVHQMHPVPQANYFDINTHLTARLARAAKQAGVGHFVFYSTIKVYGTDGWFDDPQRVLSIHSPCQPSDAYGASKWEAERGLQDLQDNAFAVAVIRPPLVYGRGVKGNLENLKKLMQNAPILPLLYPHNRRSVVSIANLMEQTKAVLDQKFVGTIVPQDSNHVSLSDFLVAIKEHQKETAPLLLACPRLFVWALKAFKPNLAKRLFGSLAFKQGEDLRAGEYTFQTHFNLN